VLGENHPNTLTMVDSLGALYRAQGKYSLAEAVFTKNLEARRRVLGEEHPEALSALANLGAVYGRQGKYSQAEPLLLRLLEIRRRVMGAQSPATTEALVLVGLVQFELRKYVDAEKSTREAISGYEKAGIDDWRPYRNLALLGASLSGQGKHAEAEAFLLAGYEGMSKREATMPFENRSELDRSVRWIAQLYRDMRRPEKAAEWEQRIRRPATSSPARQ
jgi:tetratricopeptide (TPR) repeat protein